jgi:methyl-accepting chemotaxis protein
MEWTVTRRIVSSFIGLLIFTLLMGGIGYIYMSKMKNTSELIISRKDGMATVDMLKFWTEKKNAIVLEALFDLNDKAVGDYDKSVTAIDGLITNVSETLNSTEHKEWITQVKNLDTKYNSLFHENVLPTIKTAVQARAENRSAETYVNMLHGFNKQLDDTASEALTILNKISASLKEETAEEEKVFNSASYMANIMITAFIVVGLILGITASIFTTRSITAPINRIISVLKDGADQVASASGQVSSASQSLAEGASEQASSLEETSSALQEMVTMTKQNSDSANEADKLASQTRNSAENGSTAMNEMMEAISEINESSGKISNIIKAIEEIAFQTNLLALNAAVEAARAGDAGKGFAVVAEEVRNLAQRAANAAKDTTQLIEDSVQKSENGAKIAERANQNLGEIVDNVERVAGLINEIASSSNEQTDGIGQISTSVNQMDKVIQSNASSAEESASASEELASQAQSLNGVINKLTVLIGGTSSLKSSNMSNRSTKPSADYKEETGKHFGVKAYKKKSAKKATGMAVKSEENEETMPMNENFEDF